METSRSKPQVLPVGKATLYSFFIALFSLFFIIIFLVKPREDIGIRLFENDFLYNLLFLSVSLITGLSLLPKLRIPGKASFFVILSSTLPLLFWSLSHSYLHFSQASTFSTRGFICIVFICTFAVPAYLLSLRFLTAGVVLHPRITSFVLSSVALAFGSIPVKLHCANDNTWHLTLWHFLPVIALLLLSAIFYNKKLKFL